MCTIMTFDQHSFKSNEAKILTQIFDDAKFNSDGWCLVLTGDTEVTDRINSMNLDTIITALLKSDWNRMFLHARYATGGGVNLLNTHGFSSNGYIVMHNGVLRSRRSKEYEVDSFYIKELLNIDLEYALEELKKETYANVFLIDTINLFYHVNKTQTGTLFTDNNGNFSSNSVYPCITPVPAGFQDEFIFGYALDQDEFTEQDYDEFYYNYNLKKAE